MKEPVVIITVWNGLFDDVQANIPIKIVKLEHDKNIDAKEEYPENHVEIQGYDYSVHKYDVKADPEWVAETVREVGGV